MISKPQFRGCFHVEVVEPKYVFLLDERKAYTLEGDAYVRVAPLLTGERTVEEVIQAVGDELSMAEVLYALQLLEKRGYIVEANDALPVEEAAFWSSMGVDAATAARRLGQARVTVRAVGSVPTGELQEALRGVGLEVGESAQLEVVLVDDYERPELKEINREALAAGRSWLLAKPVGVVLWMGPMFGPGDGPCWECLVQRLHGNRHVESYIMQRADKREPVRTSRGALPSTIRMASQMLATEVAKSFVLGGHDERLRDKLLTTDLLALENHEHTVVRRPQCAACGDGESVAREAKPLLLQSRKKRFTSDGGHRTLLPDETFERIKHHISPISGVVSSLERLSDDGSGMTYAYSAGHNFAMIRDDLFFLRQNLRGRSGGKGMTDIQAKVSGVCEAIERYSGVFRGDELTVRSSYRDLASEAVHPNACMLFSESQYQNREVWNAAQPLTGFHIVPEPLAENRTVDWTPLWSLTHDRRVYVPSAYCYFGHPDLHEAYFCLSDSNGNAAGNTVEEAILQGFLELVERDAVAMWWYNRLKRPAVDLDTFDEPYFNELRDYYARLGREYWVLDITSDLGIPTFAGISRRVDREVEDIVVGFGAHLDPTLAILRTMTEVSQFFPAVSKENADGSTAYWFPDTEAIKWWETSTIENRPYVAPVEGGALKTQADYPTLARDDLLDDIDTCTQIVREHGMEMLVLDQTRPDVGLNVAKVVVPGLRHFWRRLGPGRLYDVPLQLGWLEEPVSEDRLNSFSIFF